MLAERLRMMMNWTPILMFHEVLPDGGGTLPPYAVTQSQLRNILTDFIERGYTSGNLEDALYGRLERPGSKKRLVLTFDDGTRDFIEYALPVLQELRFSATLFVVTGIAGMSGGRRAWTALEYQSELSQVPLLNMSELRDLHRMGFTIGSHTVSHPWLPSLGAREVEREVTMSRQVLSHLLGDPVRWFAYPYVAADQQAVELVRRAGYAGACGGSNRQHERYYLNRMDASALTITELRRRCNGLYYLTRQALRRVPSAAS